LVVEVPGREDPRPAVFPGMEDLFMVKHRIALSAAVLAAVASTSFAADGDCRVIVGFKGGVDTDALAKHGVNADDIQDHRASGKVSASKIAELRADPSVAYVEEDAIVQASDKPEADGKPGNGGGSAVIASDPAQVLQWGVKRVWNASTNPSAAGGANVKVAVIDTGIDTGHHDLVVSGGISYVFFHPSYVDDNGHGTHVSGIIGARDNAIGVVGVAPKCSLWAVKVLDRNGSGYLSACASGIDWAASHGMNVANMSWGSSSDSTTISNSCANAYAKGVLLVAAAGNSGDGSKTTTETSYPAAYPSVVAVGATDSSDGQPYWSNTGPYVAISAPGVNIVSTYKGNAYATMSGTSMASPHAAGLAAVLWSEAASPTNATIRDLLLSHHAQHVASVTTYPDAGYGFGIAFYPYLN
jgi:minor extracellular protease Epr